MSADRVREERKATRLSVHLNIDGRWQDATIRNVSSKGLMLHCPAPPERGTFVEMRRGANVVVAQVRWSDGASFGAQSQMPVDLPRLRTEAACRIDEQIGLRAAPYVAAVPSPTPDQRAEKSRQLARVIQFTSLLAALAVAALLIMQLATEALASPLHAAEAALRAAL